MSPGKFLLDLELSTIGPINSISPSRPLLGDTTSNSALIFSPILGSYTQVQPTYPNYTLPGTQLVFPSYSAQDPDPSSFGNNPNLTLIMVPTTSSPTNDGLDLSLSAVKAANVSTGGIASTGNLVITATTPTWMSVASVEGFRSFWVVGGLVPATNYTAWVMDDNGGLSHPIWLETKEGKSL